MTRSLPLYELVGFLLYDDSSFYLCPKRLESLASILFIERLIPFTTLDDADMALLDCGVA